MTTEVGKIDLKTATTGMEGAGISSEPVSMPNSIYNGFRTNQTSEAPKFLGYTTQYAAARGTIEHLDYEYGDRAGLNPFFKPKEGQGEKFHGIA